MLSSCADAGGQERWSGCDHVALCDDSRLFQGECSRVRKVSLTRMPTPALRSPTAITSSLHSGPDWRPYAFMTECLLALCRSPELERLMPIYHRLFYFAREHCSTEGQIEDMKEICLAGLSVYAPTPDTHAARSGICYTLGECYEAELDFDSAVEVRPVTSPGPWPRPSPIPCPVWRRQAYQDALCYQPPTGPRYRDNMQGFLTALGLAHKRVHRFEAARVAYTRALYHIARLPPGPERDRGKAVVEHNMLALEEMKELVQEITRLSGGRVRLQGDPVELIAESTREQMQDKKGFAYLDIALEETREAVLAVRATRASAKAAEAGPGPGPESGGAKASKARRRRQRRKGKAAQDGRADAAGGRAEGARSSRARTRSLPHTPAGGRRRRRRRRWGSVPSAARSSTSMMRMSPPPRCRAPTRSTRSASRCGSPRAPERGSRRRAPTAERSGPFMCRDGVHVRRDLLVQWTHLLAVCELDGRSDGIAPCSGPFK
jgi:hypothetical protein